MLSLLVRMWQATPKTSAGTYCLISFQYTDDFWSLFYVNILLISQSQHDIFDLFFRSAVKVSYHCSLSLHIKYHKRVFRKMNTVAEIDNFEIGALLMFCHMGPNIWSGSMQKCIMGACFYKSDAVGGLFLFYFYSPGLLQSSQLPTRAWMCSPAA